MATDLSKYVCTNPFNYIDIQENNAWMCCPSWLPTPLQEYTGVPKLKELWESDLAISIRESVLDGSFSYCNKKVCPALNYVIAHDKPFSTIVKREEFDVMDFPATPTNVLYGFDRACNLKCPSCRPEIVYNDANDSNERQIKEQTIKQIETDFGKHIEFMLITGSGDPIYSKVYRELLQHIAFSDYPSLNRIQLITNGNLLTEKIWNSLAAKEFIDTIEISIDAGTKETYENKTRLNGDWDKLCNNVKFLLTVDSIENLTLSMVVSEINYMEMYTFYKFFNDIASHNPSNKKVNFHFTKIQHWHSSTYTVDDIRRISIFDPRHYDHELFLAELKKINGIPNVFHNFYELIG